jgi:hypothetical protein
VETNMYFHETLTVSTDHALDTGEPWGGREIARICNVGHQMVGKLWPKVTGCASSQRAYRHGKSGKATVMNTGGINKDRAEAKAEPTGPADTHTAIAAVDAVPAEPEGRAS